MRKLFYIFYKLSLKIEKKKFKFIAKYHRSLFASCGTDFQLFGRVKIYNFEKIYIGNRVRLNEGVIIQGRGIIRIMDDVTMSAYSKIFTGGYDIEKRVSDHRIKTHLTKDVFIGKGCWIAAGATILPGVKITGENVTIAAGAVVVHDVTESNCIIAGNPAKCIKSVVHGSGTINF